MEQGEGRGANPGFVIARRLPTLPFQIWPPHGTRLETVETDGVNLRPYVLAPTLGARDTGKVNGRGVERWGGLGVWER